MSDNNTNEFNELDELSLMDDLDDINLDSSGEAPLSSNDINSILNTDMNILDSPELSVSTSEFKADTPLTNDIPSDSDNNLNKPISDSISLDSELSFEDDLLNDAISFEDEVPTKEIESETISNANNDLSFNLDSLDDLAFEDATVTDNYPVSDSTANIVNSSQNNIIDQKGNVMDENNFNNDPLNLDPISMDPLNLDPIPQSTMNTQPVNSAPNSTPSGVPGSVPTSTIPTNGVPTAPSSTIPSNSASVVPNTNSSVIPGSVPPVSEPPKKKKVWPIVLACVVLFIGVLVGAGFYLLKINKTTSNAIMSAVLKPNDYYQLIEGTNIEPAMKNLENDFMTYMTSGKRYSESSNIDMKFEISDSLTSMLSAFMVDGNGKQTNDLLTSIKSVNLKTDLLTKNAGGVQYSGSLTIGLNDTDCLTINIIIDSKKEALYLQCPSVLDRWFSIKLPKEVLEVLTSSTKGKELAEDDIKTLLEKYFPILIGNFKDVELVKKQSIKVNGTAVDVNNLKVTISESDFNNIKSKLKKELKNDTLIFSYLKSYNLIDSQKDYQKAVEELFEGKKEEKDDEDDENDIVATPDETDKDSKSKESIFPLTMNVYINKQGVIVGREFVGKNNFKINYLTNKVDNDLNYTITMGDNKDNITVSGNIKETGKKYSGKTEFVVNSQESLESTIGSLYSANKLTTDAHTLPSVNDAEDITSDVVIDDTKDSEDADKTDIDLSKPSTYTVVMKYDDITFVDAKKGLMKGSITVEPKNIKSLTGTSIKYKYSVKGNSQVVNYTITVLKQEACSFTVTMGTSKQKKITVPTKSLSLEKITEAKDQTTTVLIAYNLLQEVDLYTPVKTVMTAVNSKSLNLLIKQYFVAPGYGKLNGKQTLKDLTYVAAKNPQTLKPIIYGGYLLSKQGKNPGLDKIAE